MLKGHDAMDAYCIVIDSRLMATRLTRCLATLHHAVARHPDKVDIRVIASEHDPTLESLGRRIGAHIEHIPLPSFGARSNEAARRTPVDILIFPMPRARLAPYWLDDADRLLSSHQWDAAILQTRVRHLPHCFKRLWQREAVTGALCVRRDWFERIGGFDPALDADAHADLIARLRACQVRMLEFTL